MPQEPKAHAEPGGEDNVAPAPKGNDDDDDDDDDDGDGDGDGDDEPDPEPHNNPTAKKKRKLQHSVDQGCTREDQDPDSPLKSEDSGRRRQRTEG
jgi:hypothetical protein